MTLIPKNDVNQIFGSQAPDQDKPAQFNNYTGGWDASRINNGKPTIKQFNYLQQRTDQNILYIHQNGGALPYDSTIEYAENAIVLIDGELKQKKGSQWVSPYTVKSVNGKKGDIVLSREDLGIPTDQQFAEMEKEDRFVITEDGRSQRELNNEFKIFKNAHKTVEDFEGTDTLDRVRNSFNTSDYVEVLNDDFTNELNKNKNAFSLSGHVPTKTTGEAVINIVDDVKSIEKLSLGSLVSSRWDFALGFPTNKSLVHHPFHNGFYITPDFNYIYTYYKAVPEEGYKACLVKRTTSNVLISTVELPDTAPQGETFTVLADRLYVGGKLQDPKLHIYNALTGREEDHYLWGGVTFSSRQFASIDLLDRDKIIVFGRKSGVGFGLFEYRFSKFTTTNRVKTLTLQKELAIPDIDESVHAIQGFTALNDVAYLLTEPSPSSPNNKYKTIHCYRLTDGFNFENKQCNPNAEYRATSKYGDATEVDGNWEAEGIQAHMNTHANRNSTSLFVGLMTGTGADIISEPYRALFYRCALGAENTMMPVVQGMPTRGGGTSIISGNAIEQYYLMLHKRDGVWQLAQENGDAGTTKQVVQRIEVVTVNNVEVINVYLYNPFVSRLYGQCSLSVFGYSALIDRGTYGGTTGGSFMSTKQVIVFANNSGTVVNASTVPNGTRCEIALTVLSA